MDVFPWNQQFLLFEEILEIIIVNYFRDLNMTSISFLSRLILKNFFVEVCYHINVFIIFSFNSRYSSPTNTIFDKMM